MGLKINCSWPSAHPVKWYDPFSAHTIYPSSVKNFFSRIWSDSTSNEISPWAEYKSLSGESVKIPLCGGITWLCTHTHEIYINPSHLHRMIMYGLKWKVLASWLLFFTREPADLQPERETSISMLCDRGVILMKTISYIFTSLVACYVTCDDSSAASLHCFLWLNNDHVTWWLIGKESQFGKLSN